MTTPVEPSESHTIEDRDRTADDRDHTSRAHDRASDARDDRSDARDARAADREQQGGRFDVDAAADRAGARRDRKAGAGDRKHAQDDREAASADRALAALERENLVTDGLTGAHQRAPGLAELEREIVKARLTGQSFVLALIDVDGLKAINDRQGQEAGDDVLRQVVAVVSGVVRDYDRIVRYGDDEFICGLLDDSIDGAAIRLAKAQEDLAGQGLAFSVGFAVLGGNDTLQDLIERADLAMNEQRRT